MLKMNEKNESQIWSSLPSKPFINALVFPAPTNFQINYMHKQAVSLSLDWVDAPKSYRSLRFVGANITCLNKHVILRWLKWLHARPSMAFWAISGYPVISTVKSIVVVHSTTYSMVIMYLQKRTNTESNKLLIILPKMS